MKNPPSPQPSPTGGKGVFRTPVGNARIMFAQWKLRIRLIAIVAVLAALTGAVLDQPFAYAQGDDNDYVDVGLTLEVPFRFDAGAYHRLKIAVVNHGSRTAYDVEAVVNLKYPEGSSSFSSLVDYPIDVPVGSISLEDDGYSLRWSISALGGCGVKR